MTRCSHCGHPESWHDECDGQCPDDDSPRPFSEAALCPAAAPSCAPANLMVSTRSVFCGEFDYVELMSGFERLMREIDVYLQCVAIVRARP